MGSNSKHETVAAESGRITLELPPKSLLESLGVDSSTLRSALLDYKYQAPKLSFLETLCLDGFWDWLANRVYPNWLAPNMLTLLGGACILSATLLGAWFSPSLRGEAPSWVYATNALLLFAYQSLDGSDGKQARRTKTGSALGELFDHGIDAFAVAPITLFTIDAFAFGIESVWPWLITLGAQACFLFSNLTLFHTGCMRVNPLDVIELQTAMYSSLLLTAIAGPGIWSLRIPLPLPTVSRVLFGLDWSLGIPIREGLGVWILGVMSANAIQTTRTVWLHLIEHYDPSNPSYYPATTLDGVLISAARRVDPPCTGFRPLYKQLAYLFGHITMTLLSYNAIVNTTAAAAATHQRPLLLLLLLNTTVGFAGELLRLLANRVARIPLPHPIVIKETLTYGGKTVEGLTIEISRGLVGGLAFFVCARMSGGTARYALLSLVVGAVGLDAITFFARSTQAIAVVLGLHPFRVRGAKHWYKLE